MFHVKQYAMGRPEAIAPPGGMPPQAPMLIELITGAEAGNREIRLGAGTYEWLLVKNNSGHRIVVRSERGVSVLSIIGIVEPYMSDTIPIPGGLASVFAEWAGATGAGEIAFLYFMEENPGLISQFRSPVASPDRTLFAGAAAVGAVVTAGSKIIVRAVYVVNTAATASTLTLAHRIAGVDRHILSVVSIPANTTHALGHMVLDAGNSLQVTAVTGTITLLVYGEGV